MMSTTTDNITLRRSISTVVNSSLFRKIVNGIIATEYERMSANINQKVDEILARINELSITVPLDSITAEHLQINSVTTGKLENEAVTSEKLAEKSIDTHHIKDNAITSVNLASGSITTRHLAEGSVSLPALASDITTVLDSSSSDLNHLINKVVNIENYLVTLSSTYTIKDQSNNDIVFTPVEECPGNMPISYMTSTTAVVPPSNSVLPPCPPT